jgi:argininosuccinate synthase
LKLYKGNVISAGRQSPYSLYREDFATFGYASTYSHSDAQGFINLFGLPMKVKAMVGIAPEVHEVEPSTIIRD